MANPATVAQQQQQQASAEGTSVKVAGTAIRPAQPGEREKLEKVVKQLLEQKKKRSEYQKKRNANPENKAERTAYNKKRYEQQKALMKRAAELGLLEPKKS